jgi:hypothetical protein
MRHKDIKSFSPKLSGGVELEDDEMKGDLLWGAKAMADYISELSTESIPVSRIFHWIEAGHIPAGRMGGKLVGSKLAIRKRLAQATGAA